LQEVGITKLISSTLADDLERELDRATEVAYVHAAEIEGVVKNWGLYRGRQITGEAVRAWLDQVGDVRDQRLLFKLLTHLRFVTQAQIAEMLSGAHEAVVNRLAPARMRLTSGERRRDVWITSVEAGESDVQYARMFQKTTGLIDNARPN
jgi:hypothetical protein